MGADLSVSHIDVGLIANDKDAALAFWSGLLGFPVEGEVSFPGFTIVRLKVGDAILRICVPDEPAKVLAQSGGFEAETGLRYITLGVRNLDALATAAEAAGYPVPHPPRALRPGVRAAQIQDGRGITVELVETASA